MAKIDNLLHFSHRADRRRIGSQTTVPVPRYSLYGDAAAARDWFVNVEPLDQRAGALDWTIEPHTHPKFTQLVVVDDGAGEMTLDGDLLAFAAPCVLVVPAFRIHGFRYADKAAGSVLTIEINYLGELLARGPDLKPVLEGAGAFALTPAAHATVAAHLATLTRELGGDRQGSRIGAEIELLQIILAILRDRPIAAVARPSPRHQLVDRFLALVEERYREQPDIDLLASSLSVTPTQLRGACRAILGVAPLAVLHDRVAAEAKRCLMYTTMSVAEIGYGLGFDDAAYFSRFCSRMLGRTPTGFRQQLTRPDRRADQLG